MRTKTEIGNVSLYLFWSLLKIPLFFSFTGNCKQKIWLKQLKAALALDFSYFQHVSKLVTHDRRNPVTLVVTGFSLFVPPYFYKNQDHLVGQIENRSWDIVGRCK